MSSIQLRARAVLALICWAAAVMVPAVSDGQPPAGPPDPEMEEAKARADYEARWGYMFFSPPNPNPPKRELPDYSGQGGQPVTAKAVALWFPRFVLFPAYFTVDQFVRRPLAAGVTKAEEEEIPSRVIDAFTFGDEQQYTVFPVFSFDFGLRANVGVVGNFGGVPVDHTTLNASFLFGGIDFVTGNLGVTWTPPGKKWSGAVSLGATRRADGLFFGLNDEISEDNEARFNWVGYDVGINYTVQPWRRGAISLDSGYRYIRFGDDVSGTTIPDLVEEGRISALPPGYPDGYSAWYLDPRITYDSRPPRPQSQTGVRATVGANLGIDPVRGPTDESWIVYGGSVRGFWDVSGNAHVLSLAPIVIFSDPLRRGGEVPFTELPSISGNGPMPGFIGRYLTGDSAFALNFQFTWPIWLRLDGEIQFAVGNVFPGHLDGFAFQDLRMSFVGGISAHGAERTYFELLFGGGTETFAQGPSIASVRILVGVSRDY